MKKLHWYSKVLANSICINIYVAIWKKQRIKFYNAGKDKRPFTSETADVDINRDIIVHHGDEVLDATKRLTKKSKERLSVYRKYFYEERI